MKSLYHKKESIQSSVPLGRRVKEDTIIVVPLSKELMVTQADEGACLKFCEKTFW